MVTEFSAQYTLVDHEAAVQKLALQVQSFHEAKIPFRIYHGSTNSTRKVTRSVSTSLDISCMNHIISIDKDSRIASVEPNVSMDQLVQACLKYGLVPPVIPEFPGITAGGGFAGTAGESSSFKHGFLDAAAQKIEVILGDGSIREANKNGDEEEKELIYALAGTLGTLGVLTRLDIKLIDAYPFVQLTYHVVTGFEEAKQRIEQVVSSTLDYDFVDGILYGSRKGVIVTGKMVSDIQGGKVTRFSRRRDNWFYLHIENRIEKQSKKQSKKRLKISATENSESLIDYVPLMDYLFRYDRGAFWMGKYGFSHFKLPFIKPIRTIMDSYLHTREMFVALQASRMHQKYLVEDLAIPYSNLVSFLEYVDQDFSIYPLWLCPLKLNQMGLPAKHLDTDLVVNVGVWGPWNKNHTSFKKANIALEAKVRGFKGVKWLYAQSFYSEDEFWEIYDYESYEKLRLKYHATLLPSVYDKIKPLDAITTPKTLKQSSVDLLFKFWLFNGFYGLYRVWRGSNCIIKKE